MYQISTVTIKTLTLFYLIKKYDGGTITVDIIFSIFISILKKSQKTIFKIMFVYPSMGFWNDVCLSTHLCHFWNYNITHIHIYTYTLYTYIAFLECCLSLYITMAFLEWCPSLYSSMALFECLFFYPSMQGQIKTKISSTQDSHLIPSLLITYGWLSDRNVYNCFRK